MRLPLLIYLSLAPCLVVSGVAYSQTGDDPQNVVTQIINTGIVDGHYQKVIGRLGDAGAVMLTKILADRELRSNTIGSALEVLTESFADPSFVEIPGDRQPRTALLVLRYLDLSTNDAELKKQIADTGKYVQDRYTASLQAKRP